MHQAAERDQSKILVSLDGDVSSFSPALNGEKGLVLLSDALSEHQLLMLTKRLKSLSWTFRESEYLHTNHLHCNDEDVEVLKLICEHPSKWDSAIHLEYFVYFRQHGVYLSKEVTKRSLSDVPDYWDQGLVDAVPFIGEVSKNGSLSIGSFKDWVCDMAITPYSVENLYLLMQKNPNIEISYDAVLRMFFYLSHEEQENIVNYYTPDQIMALMGGTWYLDDAFIRAFHMERVKTNTPIVRFSFIMRHLSKGKMYRSKRFIRAMTLDEATVFQDIMDRTQFAVPENIRVSSERTFNVLFYYYLKLGSTDFEELIQYAQNCENSTQESFIKALLCNSSELQEAIFEVSSQNCELPLSLRFVLGGLDWDLYPSSPIC